ncbi:hypothetical protein G6F59_018521 [Rhizopus arrhizus]|nr:hypothetical protein G6F59_018521 [Rhizopus arrhizus]
MHADDGQAHHQRSERAQEEGVALLGTQAEGDPQRGAGGTDGHRDRRGEPARVCMVAMPSPISTAPASSRRHGRLGRDTSHSA